MHQTAKCATALLGILSFLSLLNSVEAQTDGNWPQFRGSDSRGISEAKGLPDRWSTTQNVEWKRDLPGRAWSSPIVWGNRIFLTNAVTEAELEAAKKGLYGGGERPKLDVPVHRMVIALDLETGEVIWEKEVYAEKPAFGIHVKNSFASATPITDGERIYAYFGNVGLFCLDFDGNVVWQKLLEPAKIRNGWGPGASPVLGDDRLYLVNDNDEDSYMLALDKRTGEEVWRVEREEGTNWATPYIWKNAQRTEIVTPGTDKVRSYDLEGNLLWTIEGMSWITVAVPFEYDGNLLVTSGYVGDREWRPIYAIRPGAKGDITLKGEETSSEWIVWSRKLAAPYNPSTLAYRDRLFVLYDFGLFGAFDIRTGEETIEQTRFPKRSAFTVSPWAYDGKIFCMNEDGVTYVMNAGDEFEVLHTNTLAEDDMGMATPAIAGDRLIIRTSARIYSIREGAGSITQN